LATQSTIFFLGELSLNSVFNWSNPLFSSIWNRSSTPNWNSHHYW